MQIFNLHTKDTREVEDLKIVTYDEPNKFGVMKTNKYVQYTIISARPWVDFMPVREFKKLNPKVKLAGLR